MTYELLLKRDFRLSGASLILFSISPLLQILLVFTISGGIILPGWEYAPIEYDAAQRVLGRN
jgi:hypothetical protein